MAIPLSSPALVLCDDHTAYRSYLADLLRRAGLAVVGQADGVDALRGWLACHPVPPDLVLMDVQMPGGGPAGLAALLREHAGLHVLALSAHDDPAIVAAMLAAGAGGYLLKDDPLAELVDAIHGVAAGQRRLSRALPHAQQ
ncbi:response regulator transcription factor [Pseudorhodoferax sp. LjRoot39]|uniref:response regulator n=1 Tax=Pseudorhodoferax sp. LjRoot39 TaxID=3342328 RepID=UPI003ECD9924